MFDDTRSNATDVGFLGYESACEYSSQKYFSTFFKQILDMYWDFTTILPIENFELLKTSSNKCHQDMYIVGIEFPTAVK